MSVTRFKIALHFLTTGGGAPPHTGYLYGLQFSNGCSEGVTLVRIIGGAVQRRLSDAQRLSRDADAPAVQCLLRGANAALANPQSIEHKDIQKNSKNFDSYTVGVDIFTGLCSISLSLVFCMIC